MRKIMVLMTAVGLVIGVAGCGSDSSTSTSSTSSSSGGTAAAPVSLTGQTNDHGTKDVTGGDVEVELDNFYFSPTFLKVSPNENVTLHLKNESKTAHTFTSTALNVDQTLQPDQSMDVKIMTPASGGVEFHCKFHQSAGMQGAVFQNTGDTVTSAPAGTGGAPASQTPTSAPTTSTTSKSGGGTGGY